MKYIKLFENYSSSEEDEEYEEYEEYGTESIDDLKKLLIDLINEKFRTSSSNYKSGVSLGSNPLNENVFTIKYYEYAAAIGVESQVKHELKCEIKPYKNDPEVPYVVYIIKNDYFKEKEKKSPGISGPWGFAEANLRNGHFVKLIFDYFTEFFWMDYE